MSRLDATVGPDAGAASTAIVMDVKISRLEGDRLADILQAQKQRDSIPLFLSSNLPEEIIAARAKEIGARGWFRKPLTRDKLASLLQAPKMEAPLVVPATPPWSEERAQPRYVIDPKLDGSFAATPVRCANLSVSGATILHAMPLRPGTTARFTLYTRGERLFAARGRIIWSRLSPLAHAGGSQEYVTGINILDSDAEVETAIRRLLELEIARDDGSEKQRRSHRPTSFLITPRS